jgi:hypothetical protein
MNIFRKERAVVCRETKVWLEVNISFLAFNVDFAVTDNMERWVVLIDNQVIYRGDSRYECENYCSENDIPIE